MCGTPGQMGVSQKTLEHMFDTMDAQLKNGGAGAGHTWDSPPNHRKGVAMSRVSTKPENSRKQIAVEYLSLSREHVERSKRLRLHYVRLARENGLTYGEIGDALGVTEAAVRKLIERAA